MAKILVVCHPSDRTLQDNYILHALIAPWRARGNAVEIQFGWARRPAADLVIPHIDVTVLPPDALDFLAAYPNVVNRRLTDISKRRISANLLQRGDAWSGPVMVKTDANHAGIPDFVRRPPPPRWRRLLARGPQPLPPPPAARYRIYDRLTDVPPQVWRDRSLVVEKLIAQRDGSLYVLQQWWLMGDAVVHRSQVGPAPVVAGPDIVRRAPVAVAPPPELLALRARTGLDFGKVDYVQHDGGITVFDIATTPTGRSMTGRADMMETLAAGLDGLLARGRTPSGVEAAAS